MTEQQSIETEDVLESPSAKEIVLNTYALLGEDVENRKEVWRALREANVFDAGYEYFRRTYREAEEGEHDVEEAIDEQIQSVLEPVLFQAGLIPSASSDLDVEETEYPGTAPTATGSIPAEDLKEVRERIELLYNQADYTGNAEAEFVALKAIEWIDDLLESSD